MKLTQFMMLFGWMIILVPTPAFAIAWSQFLRIPSDKKREARLPFTLISIPTLSYLWLLLAATMLPSLLGPSLSDLRMWLIVMNMVTVAGLAIGVAVSESLESRLSDYRLSRFRGYIVLINALTAVPWVLMWVANSAL